MFLQSKILEETDAKEPVKKKMARCLSDQMWERKGEKRES